MAKLLRRKKKVSKKKKVRNTYRYGGTEYRVLSSSKSRFQRPGDGVDRILKVRKVGGKKVYYATLYDSGHMGTPIDISNVRVD